MFSEASREKVVMAVQLLPLRDVWILCPLALRSACMLFPQKDRSMPVSGGAT